MTLDDLIELCEPLVGRPRDFDLNDYNGRWHAMEWWCDAAAALAKENERLQREVAEWKSLVNQIQS